MKLDRSRLGRWAELPFFEGGAIREVERRLAAETRPWLPRPDTVLAALELTQPDAVRVVVLGQDPYPTPGHANGLAFSVATGIALPASLRNIFTELESDIGSRPRDGDLRGWARQGVLLLNTVLTVPAGEAGGHRQRVGWEPLTGQVLARISARPTAFVLWGRPAQRLGAQHIAGTGHERIETAHPSPLSARRGFFGSKPFSRVNRWLAAQGAAEIDWTAAA